jgi:hypothetical protein
MYSSSPHSCYMPCLSHSNIYLVFSEFTSRPTSFAALAERTKWNFQSVENVREFPSRVRWGSRQPARTGGLEHGSWAVTKQRIMRTNWEELACSYSLTFLHPTVSVYISAVIFLNLLYEICSKMFDKFKDSLYLFTELIAFHCYQV